MEIFALGDFRLGTGVTLPNAQFRLINTPFGHLATFALSKQDTQAIDNVLRELLAA